MKLKRLLCTSLIVILATINFSGCKINESTRNNLLITGVFVSVLEVGTNVFGTDIRKIILEIINKLFPPDKPPPPPPVTEYARFTDATYAFSFDYPTKIDGKSFDGKPKLINQKTVQIQVPAPKVEIQHRNISGHSNNLQLNCSNEYITISGNSNTIEITGSGNIIQISGHSHMIYCDKNFIFMSGHSNSVIGDGNAYSIGGHSNVVIGTNNYYSGESLESVIQSKSNPMTVVNKEILNYAINLGNSSVESGNRIVTNVSKFKNELKSNFTNANIQEFGDNVIQMKYKNSATQDFHFIKIFIDEKNYQYYWVEALYKKTTDENELKIINHVLNSFNPPTY